MTMKRVASPPAPRYPPGGGRPPRDCPLARARRRGRPLDLGRPRAASGSRRCRSSPCWDYHLKPAAFLRWLDALEASGLPSLNPAPIVRWNVDKRYLRDLAARGVRIPETAWIEKGERVDLAELLRARGLDEVVIKPQISLSAYGTFRASRASAAAAQPQLDALVAERAMMVQAFLPAILARGELSFVFLGGQYSHTVRKTPRAGDFRVQNDYGGTRALEEPPPSLIAEAARALDAGAPPLLYARIDVVETSEGLVLMELEAIDPVLFLAQSPGAPERFADSIARALGAPSRTHENKNLRSGLQRAPRLVRCGSARLRTTERRSAAAPPATAAVALSPDPPRLRLPDVAFPTRYEAELTLDPARESFTGVVSIHLAARRSTRIIWLHAQDITVRTASFSQGGAAQPASVLPGSAPFVGFALPADLSPEKAGVLRIEYEGKIDGERPQGVYSVSEGGGADARYLYSLFEPLDARRAFPCFDEPEYKVPWKLAIRVRKEHTAFSNAEAVSETDEGAMKRIDFAETPPIPSYLVAFMAGPFEVVDAGTVGREKKRLRFIVPRGRGAETRYAAQVTPSIVAQLEDYFGMPYPYSKLDVAVVPRYEGTMEHPGIVGLGQPLTLIKPGEEALSRKQSYVDIAAHELAHYWFGDYVTMKWWDDTWLNESFAQWMDAKITDAVEPSWSFGRASLRRSSAAMSADRLASAKKMRQPVESAEDILNAFDGNLTYNKGSAVISMLEHAVTPAIWQKTVRQYMARHAWKTTAADDFIAMITEVAGADAAGAFASFLNQPGVPLVTVAPVCGASPPKLRPRSSASAAGHHGARLPLEGASVRALRRRRREGAAVHLPERGGEGGGHS